MIHIRSWWTWQGACIARVVKNRRWRNESPKVAAFTEEDAPFAMQQVAVSSSFDGDFGKFAASVRKGNAESYFLRVLQYAAHHSAVYGIIDISPDLFGPIVLSRSWHAVSKREGRSVYRALIDSELCVEMDSDAALKAHFEEYLEASRDKSRKASLARPRSLTFPSRPGPSRGKGSKGRKEGGSAPAPAGEGPPSAPPPGEYRKLHDTLAALDRLLAAPPFGVDAQSILRAKAKVKLGHYTEADALLARNGT